jgi:hypothetical protein
MKKIARIFHSSRISSELKLHPSSKTEEGDDEARIESARIRGRRMALRLHEDHSGVRDPAPPPQQIRVDASSPTTRLLVTPG